MSSEPIADGVPFSWQFFPERALEASLTVLPEMLRQVL